jgi:hypothetical protein
VGLAGLLFAGTEGSGFHLLFILKVGKAGFESAPCQLFTTMNSNRIGSGWLTNNSVGARILRSVFGAVLALGITFEASALELTITNHSFENPALSDGGGAFSVFGWASVGTVQIYNPDNSFFAETTAGSPVNPLDGSNAVGINSGGRMTYETGRAVATDSIYTLTFLAGNRFGTSFGNGSVSLWAGTNFLGQRLPTPASGTFQSYSLMYTSPPAGPMIGMPLRIELAAPSGDTQPWFDNFRLFEDNYVCTPHKASATAQLVNGILVGITILDPGCGYSNAPTVTIQGGGGNGATARAVLAGDRVSSIQISNGGCCYTNVPTVIIESPPRIPTVKVRVSKVMVTQELTLGRRYVLESSTDLITWNATGPSFMATSETVENEFDVGLAGHFFRVREVP